MNMNSSNFKGKMLFFKLLFVVTIMVYADASKCGCYDNGKKGPSGFDDSQGCGGSISLEEDRDDGTCKVMCGSLTIIADSCPSLATAPASAAWLH